VTRRSRREIERAVEDLASDAVPEDARCPECGGRPPGYDDAEGVTAEFVTYECTCDGEGRSGRFDVVVPWEQGDDWEPDDDALVVDFSGVDT